MGWVGIIAGAAFTIVLTLLADLVAMATQSPTIAAVLSAVAFFLAGFLVVRLRPATHPLEPGIGAGAVVLALSVARLSMMQATQPGLSGFQIGLSIFLAVVIAFLLAWYGGRLSVRLHARRLEQAHPPRPR
jgi:hypothetical protein